jgi:hypothetical protein
MRTIDVNTFTAQQKNMQVAKRLGNTGLKNQQGSTVVLYDTLPLDGSTEFRFFEGSAQRNFPLSNTGSDGNKLGVGQSLVLERFYLSIVREEEPGVKTIEPVDINALGGILLGELTVTVANSEIIKKVPILSTLPNFNKISENQLNCNFEFDTMAVIQPLLEFVCALRCDTYVADPESHLRLTIEGSGSVIAPRVTF